MVDENQQREVDLTERENLLICECFCVGIEEINQHFKGQGIDLKKIQEEFSLGRGCGSCLKDLNWLRLLNL